MGWRATSDWPEQSETGFRDEAPAIALEFECRRASLKERLCLFRNRPNGKPIAKRFCLTAVHLFVELSNAETRVIERDLIDSLEVHGAHLAIGTKGSQVHFVPSFGDESTEALIALAPH